MAVYFIRAGFDGPVKIGHTNDLQRRRNNLQTAADVQMRVIAELDGGRELERWAHWRFRHLRIRGEWFAFDNAMLTLASELEGGIPLVPGAPGALPTVPSITDSSVSMTVDRVRAWLGSPESGPLARIAAAAGIDEKTLRLSQVPGWNPTASTLGKLEALMPRETPPFDLEGAKEFYGSAKAIARRLGVPPTTVASWVQTGSVPIWRQQQINEALRHDGAAT